MAKTRRIYNRIKSWLALKQVKNKELAEYLGVSPPTVSKWCTNESQPSIPDLYRIAEYLQIEVADLLMPISTPAK
jgi:transcriptional regulator with XRE-family HTH domain